MTPGSRKGALDRLQYFARRGLVKKVAHGVYAAVPPGVASAGFTADRYLVAASLRDDAVFAYHAALELLGAAHSDWNECTVLTRRRRPPAVVGGVTLRFVPYPTMLVRQRGEELGVREVDRLGRRLRSRDRSARSSMASGNQASSAASASSSTPRPGSAFSTWSSCVTS
jgi:hypothetical protein